MKKITNLNNNIFFRSLFLFTIIISLVFNPNKVHAEISETEINGELIYPSIYKLFIINYLSDRRTRLHEILLTLINKESNFELIEEDSGNLTTNFSDKDTANLSRVIEKNRKIIKRYQALVRTAVTLDALMDSENDENFKIK